MGVQLVDLNLLDREQTMEAVRALAPNEIYNLTGHSFIPQSWEYRPPPSKSPVGPRCICSTPSVSPGDPFRRYQSSTIEIFCLSPHRSAARGHPRRAGQPLRRRQGVRAPAGGSPPGPYALFACSGMLYNHESPQRPPQFVTQKVARAARRIAAGQERELLIGDLDVSRDWGFAGDFVDAMWRLLRQPEPLNCVISTGVAHTVRDLCQVAFAEVDGPRLPSSSASDPSLEAHGELRGTDRADGEGGESVPGFTVGAGRDRSSGRASYGARAGAPFARA
jgi:GDPmannose 4,6-dehydratase